MNTQAFEDKHGKGNPPSRRDVIQLRSLMLVDKYGPAHEDNFNVDLVAWHRMEHPQVYALARRQADDIKAHLKVTMRGNIKGDDVCVECGVGLLPQFDADPNGSMNPSCARCRAENAHDFDADPDAAFDRAGHVIELTQNEIPFSHQSSNGTIFVTEWSDFIGGVKVSGAPEHRALLASDIAEFVGFHATHVLPQLITFPGYDMIQWEFDDANVGHST